jgi:hypothetical protein
LTPDAAHDSALGTGDITDPDAVMKDVTPATPPSYLAPWNEHLPQYEELVATSCANLREAVRKLNVEKVSRPEDH